VYWIVKLPIEVAAKLGSAIDLELNLIGMALGQASSFAAHLSFCMSHVTVAFDALNGGVHVR
jgi:hypothetical protein